MKDIRPLYKKVEKILDQELNNLELAKELISLRNEQCSLEEDYIPSDVEWATMADLDRVDKEGNIWSKFGYMFPEWEFNEEVEKLKQFIRVRKTKDWPDSSDSVSFTYAIPSRAFGLAIIITVSGIEVICPKEDLKKEVEQALSQLNQNQSAQNFLLNVVYVLPKKYKEYKLVI